MHETLLAEERKAVSSGNQNDNQKTPAHLHKLNNQCSKEKKKKMKRNDDEE